LDLGADLAVVRSLGDLGGGFAQQGKQSAGEKFDGIGLEDASFDQARQGLVQRTVSIFQFDFAPSFGTEDLRRLDEDDALDIWSSAEVDELFEAGAKAVPGIGGFRAEAMRENFGFEFFRYGEKQAFFTAEMMIDRAGGNAGLSRNFGDFSAREADAGKLLAGRGEEGGAGSGDVHFAARGHGDMLAVKRGAGKWEERLMRERLAGAASILKVRICIT
jgi:hypothetical protein